MVLKAGIFNELLKSLNERNFDAYFTQKLQLLNEAIYGIVTIIVKFQVQNL